MIEPQYARWADSLFSQSLRRTFRRHFHRVRLLGSLPEMRSDLPVLLLPTHGTWWDGYFVHLLNRLLLGRRLHLVMQSDQLARKPFLRRVGAVGFDPENPVDVLALLRWAQALLDSDRHGETLLTLYPQGEMTPLDRRPLGVQPGAAWLATRCRRPLSVLPLAMRVDMLTAQRPEVALAFGDPMVIKPHETVSSDTIEAALEAILDRLTSAVNGNGPSLEPERLLIQGRLSMADSWLHV